MDMQYITSKIVMPVMAVSLAAVILPFIAAYSIIQVSGNILMKGDWALVSFSFLTVSL